MTSEKENSALELKKFSEAEHHTWNLLFTRQVPLRDVQLHPMFSAGIKKLGLNESRIPTLFEVNKKLKDLTGFQAVPVTGLEDVEHFFTLLSERKFPIGNFIRDQQDLSYTPAPDVFHDMYGHIPFLVDKRYADYCCEVGKRALEMKHLPNALTYFNRYFWFTIEFALVKTQRGKQIFGAGIASSFGECAYALSDKPEVVPFDLKAVMQQDFRIDEMQKRLFILDSPEQLYESLEPFCKLVEHFSLLTQT